MLNLETPQASAVRTNTLTVSMVGADGPALQYSIDFGREVDGAFVVAYSTSGAVDGANAAAFVQQFASIEPAFLGFLANIGVIPPVA